MSKIIELHTRTPRPGGDAIAQIGKGKSAYKTTCTAGEKLAAHNLVTKYYGAAAAETLTKTNRLAENGSAVWEFQKLSPPASAPSANSAVKPTEPSPSAIRNSPSPSKTELIEPGQLSKTLEKSLKERGKGISDNALIEIISQTESTRVKYQVRSIMTGVVLLAKKKSLKHGQWLPFLEELFEKGNAVSNLKCVVFDDHSAGRRILNIYMYLAKRFLWKVETNGFIAEMVESDQKRINCTATQILDLVEAQSPEEQPLFTEIHRFVGGRSLRRMLADFRQAEKDADEEAQREAHAAAKDPANTQVSGLSPQPSPPKPVQLLLWEQFQTRKLPILDAVFDEPGTEDLSGEDAILHYSQIAEAFEERAKRARQLAEAAKEGKGK